MGTAGGTPTYGWSCTFLFRATPRRDPNRTLFVRKPTSETPAAGTSRATPPGPQDATDQPQRLPKVSSRHFGDAFFRIWGCCAPVGPLAFGWAGDRRRFVVASADRVYGLRL